MVVWNYQQEGEAEIMRKAVICALLLICLIMTLTGCEKEQEISETVSMVETTEVPEDTAAATESVAEEPTQPEVVVGFLPTDKPWQYVAIKDQEAAVAAMEKAIHAIYSDEWWIKGDRTNGLQVEYEGEIWTFVESGELVYPLGRVKAEDAADLYDLCVEAARKAGWKDAIKPEQFTGIVSATLRAKAEEYRLTDAAALDKLESMLSSGKYELGGTGCPFTALLDVTLESGEILTVALATDSCGVWMTEGYYYSYGSDSQPLYDLFGVTMDMVAPYNKG
jgi:hypothetical protein